jgi:monolysocardiolipin acyltransferase
MLTISNHLSVMDDPGLWAALLPWWRFRPNQMRWNLCTDDVFFFHPLLSKIIAAGNVFPLDRSGSLEQPLFKCYQDKLNTGSWVHIFAEGRVWQEWRFENNEQRLGPFKIGVGKLIAHSVNNPLIVPMYHKGLDQIIPEKILKDKKKRKASTPISLIPRIGKNVEVYIGKPIDFQSKLEAFDHLHGVEMRKNWQATSELLALYTDLANDVREAVLELEALAFKRAANEADFRCAI